MSTRPRGRMAEPPKLVSAEMAMIELVDFNEIYTQNKNVTKSAEPKKKTRRAGATKKAAAAPKKKAAKKDDAGEEKTEE